MTIASSNAPAMGVETTPIEGLLVIEPRCFRDERGFFLETYQEDRYRAHGIGETFVQDNHSRSVRGVLRGLHFQIHHTQAKLVTILRGCVFDAVVDLRVSSPTFGRWFGLELSDARPRQLFVPAGFAHGFCTLSEIADLHYKVSRPYNRADEGGLVWNDPAIGIDWPIETPIMAPRDASFPRLAELTTAQLPQVAFRSTR